MIVSIYDDKLFAIKIAEYQNGILTTAGLFSADAIKPAIKGDIVPVTYGIAGMTELPADWYTKQWKDDRGGWLRLVDILYSNNVGFRMEDNYISKHVTIYMEVE